MQLFNAGAVVIVVDVGDHLTYCRSSEITKNKTKRNKNTFATFQVSFVIAQKVSKAFGCWQLLARSILELKAWPRVSLF